MKWRFLILLLLVCQISLHAAHIAGGELQYEYVGPGAGNTDRYRLTMRLFRECSSTGPQLANEIVNVGAYSSLSLSLQTSAILPLVSGINQIRLVENAIPCLVGSPDVCYQVAIYSNEVDLPRLPEGITLAWARCCRATGLINAQGQLGATYIAKIPGTNILASGYNNSPQFVVKDTALVCGDSDFYLDFGASDVDGDSLSYEFCDAYLGGTTTNQSAPPPATLNLQPLPYGSGYSGAQPLGSHVTINKKTGMISGVAPATPGRYVVNVCVTEWRNGFPISQHRKDFILKVGDCNIIAAKLNEQYVECTSFTRIFANEANSSQIKSYFWDFGVTTTDNDTSNLPTPSFTFPDTGIYHITLMINRNEECGDTARAVVKVYPGFTPKFVFSGSCYLTPFQFTDSTKTRYGTVNSWKWDFGVPSVLNDTSRLKNPVYQYSSIGDRTVTLWVTTDKGCSGTYTQLAKVSDKPYLFLPFKDTLICSKDSLLLQAEGTGNFHWSPAVNIINTSLANATVFPSDTITYFVELNENSCVAKDSIRINVLDSVTVQTGMDTAICQTDSLQLKVVSPALSYSWSPSEGLNDVNARQPFAAPYSTTTYYVVASVGKCHAKDSVQIRVSPYPVSNAGKDTSICFGDKFQLNGAVMCNDYLWSSTSNVMNGNSLHPIAAPSKTTSFILTAVGYQECPKTVHDTITIVVFAPVKAFAGNDTLVTVNEPLQLKATGGKNYSWSPANYINNASSATPVVTLGNNIDSMLYRVTVTTEEGCVGSDDIKIVVFKTGPQIFIPDAFTPNNDGLNDLVYPVIVGMKQFSFFRVYNRYGQMLFSTSEVGKGWDGRFGGKEQPSGTYVYMAQAINYKGTPVFKKGTVLLMR